MCLNVLSYSLGWCSLTSDPPQFDGVVTVCSGGSVSLTCSHNNTETGNTRWIIFSSGVTTCSTTISGSSSSDACEPYFTFVDESELSEGVVSSIAQVASANTSMNDIVVECRDSAGIFFTSIGNISFCVIGLFLSSS